MKLFNFDRDWHLVQPHLHKPDVQEALRLTMGHILTFLKVDDEWDGEHGPWYYSVEDDESLDEFYCDRGCPSDPVKAMAWKRKNFASFANDRLAVRDFIPTKDSPDWYRCESEDWGLAVWQALIGKRMRPDLKWYFAMCSNPDCDVAIGINAEFESLRIEETIPEEALVLDINRKAGKWTEVIEWVPVDQQLENLRRFVERDTLRVVV